MSLWWAQRTPVTLASLNLVALETFLSHLLCTFTCLSNAHLLHPIVDSIDVVDPPGAFPVIQC
jgi:hypothetical protein